MSESTAQALSRLVHHGGKILVVGGGVADMPDRYTRHPAIEWWDDNDQGCLHKEIPLNVRAILWNRWISHAMAGRLNDIVRARRILKFPMLRTKEIKNLLSELINTPVVEETMQIHEQPVFAAAPPSPAPEPKEEPVTVATVTVAPQKKETIRSFVAKHLSLNGDWTKRGSVRRESERLTKLAKEQQLKFNPNSIRLMVGTVIKELGLPAWRKSGTKREGAAKKTKVTSASPKITTVKASKINDDFSEFEHLVVDAIAAMELVREHLPKVRKETERLRTLREKMRTMLDE